MAKTFGLEVERIEAEDTVDYDGDPVTDILFVLNDDTPVEPPLFKAIGKFENEFTDEFFNQFPDKNPLLRFVTDRELKEAEEEDEDEMEGVQQPPAA